MQELAHVNPLTLIGDDGAEAFTFHVSQKQHGSEPMKRQRPLQFRSRDFQSRLLGRDAIGNRGY